MKTPTFREQYDKIVGSYLRNELKPTRECACFVGNLLNNTATWAFSREVNSGTPMLKTDFFYKKDRELQSLECVREQSGDYYTYQEVLDLEHNFLIVTGNIINNVYNFSREINEESLFKAMESTLMLLKKIHESKGEKVEDYVFERRELKEEKV